MLHLALAQIMQVPLPVTVLFQILGHVLGDEDMTSVTTIHHALRDVDSGAGNVGATTYVHHAADRPAVNPHAELEIRMFFRSAADLQRALHWRFRSVVEHQRHSISSRHGNET